MAEDVANDFRGCSAFDLTGRVGVSEHVRAKKAARHARGSRVHREAMPDHTRRGERSVRKPGGNEYRPAVCVQGSPIT